MRFVICKMYQCGNEKFFLAEEELKDIIAELSKRALMNNVQDCLMELGRGFAFVGREYRLVVGKTEQYIDLLFYSIKNHCYVVVEVKVTDFEPRDMGQLATYVAIVDDMIREKGDGATVGLLICKIKDNVLAKYAVNFSYPYSKVQYFGIETAGMLDIDSELVLVFANGAHVQFDFQAKVNIMEICSYISDYIL